MPPFCPSLSFFFFFHSELARHAHNSTVSYSNKKGKGYTPGAAITLDTSFAPSKREGHTERERKKQCPHYRIPNAAPAPHLLLLSDTFCCLRQSLGPFPNPPPPSPMHEEILFFWHWDNVCLIARLAPSHLTDMWLHCLLHRSFNHARPIFGGSGNHHDIAEQINTQHQGERRKGEQKDAKMCGNLFVSL